jgi:hypothetical protein
MKDNIAKANDQMSFLMVLKEYGCIAIRNNSDYKRSNEEIKKNI